MAPPGFPNNIQLPQCAQLLIFTDDKIEHFSLLKPASKATPPPAKPEEAH